MERICTFTENSQNAQKVEYLGKFETKIEIFFGCLSGATMGSIGQIMQNQKKYHASVPLQTLISRCTNSLLYWVAASMDTSHSPVDTSHILIVSVCPLVAVVVALDGKRGT